MQCPGVGIANQSRMVRQDELRPARRDCLDLDPKFVSVGNRTGKFLRRLEIVWNWIIVMRRG